MSKISWGLIAEHPDKKLRINRAPRRSEVLYRDSDVPRKISRVIDYDGELWIFLENGEEEIAEELTPIDIKES